MPATASSPTPDFNLVVALLNAHAAFERAIVLSAVRDSTTVFDPEQLQIEIDAANAVVAVEAFNLRRVVEEHATWLNSMVEPAVFQQFADISLGQSGAEWLQSREGDFASNWQRALGEMMSSEGVRSPGCATLGHHVLTELAVCTVMGGACPFFIHEGVMYLEACAFEPPPHR